MKSIDIRRSLIILTALAGAASMACSSALAASKGTRAGWPNPSAVNNDTEITNAVENELIFDRAVSLNDITVKTQEGIVTLTGKVSSLLEKQHAEKLASTVKGVRSIINRVKVAPHWGLTDRELERDAESALLYNRATESYEVDVDVTAHLATLTGTVDSWHERELAETVVSGVKGIHQVNNHLKINYAKKRSDFEIEQDIKKALRWDALVDHEGISVGVENGKVTLSGTVGSLAEKTQAYTDGWVNGVASINDDELKIRSWAKDPNRRTSSFIPKSDGDIAHAVEDAMFYDPRVASYEVQTSAKGGVVTLRGKVDTLTARSAAEQVARTTTGVIDVNNRIRLSGYTPSDATVASRVRGAMARDPYVESYEVRVDVNNGKVELEGTVDSYFEKYQAYDVAAQTAGVREIHNNIAVRNPAHALVYDPYVHDFYPYTLSWYDYQPVRTYTTDWQITKNIGGELFWSPFVDAHDVAVLVDDGVATLTGKVDSYSEMYAAIENAYEGGAVWVNNDLKVLR